MADIIPFYKPGDDVTGHCTAAVTGGRFVKISAQKQADGTYSISHAAAGDRVLGVAARDGAIGDRIPVYTEGIVPVQNTGGALAAGAEVQSGAAGVAIVLAAGKAAGQVMADAADGAMAEVKLQV